MSIKIRPETEDDHARISEVNDLAFGQKNEGKLIEELRKNDQFIPGLSLVAELDGLVVGHILFYPITINCSNTKHLSLALAPMSVIPEHQNKKIGSLLVKEGLRLAKMLGYESVIVVGHPQYYPRFGFSLASQWGIKLPFEVPDTAFLALELIPEALKDRSGVVEYPKEFEAV